VIAMMSPHTHVALTQVRDREDVRKAAHRPDAKPDPIAEEPLTAMRPSRARRSLAWLHLSRPHHA
jgi:hypothetical protein